VFDEHGLPTPVVPDQDIGPWEAALESLLTDRALYEDEAQRSYQAAAQFVGRIQPGRMEEFLKSLAPRRDRAFIFSKERSPKQEVAALSAERRALLAERLLRKHQRRPH